MSMSHNEIEFIRPTPALREPILLVGFAGWNDAGDAATFSLETLITAWSPARFAEIDPEGFFDFTETRPMISLDASGQRSLEWPENAFYAHALPNQDRDVVLLLGTEPQLRWKTFCRHILAVAERVHASCLLTLGALMADVPHTREPTCTGFVSSSPMLPQLQKLGVKMSSYEGPTGILGALHEAWRATNRPAISLWGNVPHYISATPNPQVALALLRRVGMILGTPVPVSSVEKQAQAFAVQVEEALRENPEAQEYVHQLEEQYAAEVPPTTDGPGLFEALEEFLRSSRPAEGSE
jgi:proteasome assembly chaperone (PAC2) family protein